MPAITPKLFIAAVALALPATTASAAFTYLFRDSDILARRAFAEGTFTDQLTVIDFSDFDDYVADDRNDPQATYAGQTSTLRPTAISFVGDTLTSASGLPNAPTIESQSDMTVRFSVIEPTDFSFTGEARQSFGNGGLMSWSLRELVGGSFLFSGTAGFAPVVQPINHLGTLAPGVYELVLSSRTAGSRFSPGLTTTNLTVTLTIPSPATLSLLAVGALSTTPRRRPR